MAWSSRACHQARQSSFPLVVAFGASGALEGCASDPVIDGSEQVGSLGVRLEVAPGVTLNSVTYSITGNGFSKTGTIDTSGAPAISATIGGIPAGNGYTITLTATSIEAGTTFTGSATFNVSPRGTTPRNDSLAREPAPPATAA